jgi:hypothetical protein
VGGLVLGDSRFGTLSALAAGTMATSAITVAVVEHHREAGTTSG